MPDGFFNQADVATAPALNSIEQPDGRYAHGLILVNPRSFRMSLRGRLDRVRELSRDRQVPLVLASDPGEIGQHVRAAVDAGADLLTLLGGDGTLQAAVTTLGEIHAAQPGIDLPRLLMLGGGRTNYTARDLGTHHHLVETLATALDQPEQLGESIRHSLLVEQGNQRQHGFFIAGALVDHVIRDCHEYRAGGLGFLRTGHLSSGWRVLQLGTLALLGRSKFTPPHIKLDAPGLGHMDCPLRLLLVTSLHHRSEWIDPYADRGTGEVRVAAIASGAEGFWRQLPWLATGRYGPNLDLERGYLSGRTSELRLQGLANVSLDGQEYDYDASRPIWVRTGPALRFVHR